MDSPQQVCESYPAFQNKVFEMALDPDPVMIGVALDTLGLLGSTVEGKQVLQKTGNDLCTTRLIVSNRCKESQCCTSLPASGSPHSLAGFPETALIFPPGLRTPYF